jgi:hypothetical protein
VEIYDGFDKAISGLTALLLLKFVDNGIFLLKSSDEHTFIDDKKISIWCASKSKEELTEKNID